MCTYTSRHRGCYLIAHYLHILLQFLHPQGRNHAFGLSNGAPWLVWLLGFGQITSIIANDVANEPSHRIKRVLYIFQKLEKAEAITREKESDKREEKARYQSGMKIQVILRETRTRGIRKGIRDG